MAMLRYVIRSNEVIREQRGTVNLHPAGEQKLGVCVLWKHVCQCNI